MLRDDPPTVIEAYRRFLDVGDPDGDVPGDDE